uniref:Uncharacterized protein n=1 Tax=Trichobilharzia regenti TaxID=157069 RepID=A0AA85JEL6_TRIRE|nr:unnamed protein product [Trichobilharzia regenti]
MDYILPTPTTSSSSSGLPSSIIFHGNSNPEGPSSSLISALLLNIANEAATRQLRTVFIRKEAILKCDFVHIHGCSRLDTSNWDDIHFVYLPSEDALIRWLSSVHMQQRFADLIIVEALDQLVKNNKDSSYIIRLTNLLEDTRQFIHNTVKDTEHGHNCGLIVSTAINNSSELKKINLASPTHELFPAHALARTYLLHEENEDNCFQLYSIEDNWRLNIKKKYDEVFWIADD